jgi:hypothetical protein
MKTRSNTLINLALVSFASVATILLSASAAHAEETKQRVVVASLQLNPSAEVGAAAPVASAAPEADAIEKNKQDAERASRGFTFSGHAGAFVQAGNVFSGETNPFGPSVGFALMATYYPIRHLGISAGLRYNVGTTYKDCQSEGEISCYGHGLQIPIIAEFAAHSRHTGPYLQAGLGFVNLQEGGKQLGDKKAGLAYSAPITFKGGMGYRIPLPAKRAWQAIGSIDVGLAFDFGTYSKLALEIGAENETVDIASEKQRMHINGMLSVGFNYHAF